jgi:hypothetical protein
LVAGFYLGTLVCDEAAWQSQDDQILNLPFDEEKGRKPSLWMIDHPKHHLGRGIIEL